MQKVRQLGDKEEDPESTGEPVNGSLVTYMTAMACNLVKNLDRKCILVLEAFFAAGSAFLAIEGLVDAAGKRWLHLITRAKGNAVAFEEPGPISGRRGRPPVYGKKVPMAELFRSRREEFQQAKVETYEKQKVISFLCLDLIWKPLPRPSAATKKRKRLDTCRTDGLKTHA